MKKWAISVITGLLAGVSIFPSLLAGETKVPPGKPVDSCRQPVARTADMYDHVQDQQTW